MNIFELAASGNNNRRKQTQSRSSINAGNIFDIAAEANDAKQSVSGESDGGDFVVSIHRQVAKNKAREAGQAAPAGAAQSTPDAGPRKVGAAERSAATRKRLGRRSLRIDPQTGGVGGAGSGVNVPSK